MSGLDDPRTLIGLRRESQCDLSAQEQGKHAEGVGVFQAIFDCSERQSTQASEVFSRGFHDSSNRQEKDFLGESTSGDWRMTQSRANGYMRA